MVKSFFGFLVFLLNTEFQLGNYRREKNTEKKFQKTDFINLRDFLLSLEVFSLMVFPVDPLTISG